MDYKVRIQNIAGDDVYDVPFDNFSFTEALNLGMEGSLDISYRALTQYAAALNTTVNNILSGQLREVLIYKGTTPLFLGVIADRGVDGGGFGASKIRLKLGDYVYMLSKRRTDDAESETATDSVDIIWNRINASQMETNGDLGITLMGSPPTTKNRDRTMTFDNLRDLLVGMSNEKVKDGYDFDIDPTKTLNFYYPTKGQTRDNIVFNGYNSLEWSEHLPLAGRLTNRVYVTGQDASTDWVARNDTTNRAAWLLHEDVITKKGVSETDTLNDHGDRFLELNTSPSAGRSLNLTHLEGTPAITSYNVGDVVKVKLADIEVDATFRVMRRSLRYNKGNALVDLTLE